jgi:hypothetical protein
MSRADHALVPDPALGRGRDVQCPSSVERLGRLVELLGAEREQLLASRRAARGRRSAMNVVRLAWTADVPGHRPCVLFTTSTRPSGSRALGDDHRQDRLRPCPISLAPVIR